MNQNLSALKRLQAGSNTPIHDQLVLERAVRQLTVDLRPVMEGFRRVMETVGSNFANMAFEAKMRAARDASPEVVLDRIRQDQQVLDWREQWRAERGQL